jgi:hypothetical protein
MESIASAPVQTRHASHTARRIIPALIAVPLFAWTAWWGYKHVMWWTPAGQEIARVVRGAAGVNENLLTPPQAYRNVPITAAQMSALSAEAQSKLAGYYAGPELSGWRSIARRTLDPKSLHSGKTDAWMLHWQVDWVRLGELTLFPWSATATATASVQYSSSRGAINRLSYTWHLVDTRAGWRTDREESAFEPGYGP